MELAILGLLKERAMRSTWRRRISYRRFMAGSENHVTTEEEASTWL